MINLNATLLIQLANFLLLMFLLNRLLFRPMVRILDERKERTEGRKKKAAQVDGEAEALWAEYQKRLQEAKADADRIRSELARKAEGERQNIVEAAAREAEKTVAAIRARIRGEAAEAGAALRAEAGRLGADMAQRILGRSI